ncbi:MAG: GTPase ObgE [Betaproteobacteria bacterium TMED82]|nr:MAG: GTPase ObgE [Betaproteobacteria bacterium TMED82]|tara:strand:+ start:62757 stop:63839 length:1083 start_codon:yes stop_codon:yes gene_type:complete
MKFIDEAKIKVKGGDGGAGVAAFRREKFIPKGGPAGGDGGAGGSVYGIASNRLNTLLTFRFTRIHEAKRGEQGGGKDKNGQSGEDLIVEFPVGTLVYDDDTNLLLADLNHVGERVLLAKGGDGGLGNLRFKSSTNRTPRQFTYGELGEIRELRLELKVLADVGLVGLPNSGKSTLISKISSARPKIADYPFTTLSPNLGVLSRKKNEYQMIIADIPGLIEGAADGTGLGIHFLKHVQRTRLLLHLVDISTFCSLNSLNKRVKKSKEDIIGIVNSIVYEMEKFDPTLKTKPRWIVLNKIDLLLDSEIRFFVTLLKDVLQLPIYQISCFSEEGLNDLISELEYWFGSFFLEKKNTISDVRFK